MYQMGINYYEGEGVPRNKVESLKWLNKSSAAGYSPAADAIASINRAEAEKRRAAAVAREQEMRALVEENRAKVVEAEAQVPQAISEAFKSGHMGVMDFYNMKNLQSDTTMRNNIASLSGNDSAGRS